MRFSKMTVDAFIKYMITCDTVDVILDSCKTQVEKGFIYERLWDICIKFGFQFDASQYTHMVGNVNINVHPLTTFEHYLTENVISGNSSGISDITLLHTPNTFIFISSKYPKSTEDVTKQKSVDYYDVQKIIAMADANKHLYPKYKIMLLVPDKKSVLEKVKASNKSSNYITKYMTEEHILDKNDLNKCFLKMKAELKHSVNYEIFLTPKSRLSLRFHQELITQKTSVLMEEGNKRFLWGCKCRSGKTYMVGGLLLKQRDVKPNLNVLILTPAPTETGPQFTDELFYKFQEFGQFKVHPIESSKQFDDIILGESNIFVLSKQLIQSCVGDKTIKCIKNVDIIISDENHFTGTTEISKRIYN